MVEEKKKMKRQSSMLTPVFIVLGILSVFLFINLMPTSVFGTEWTTIKSDLWTYMPWIVVFGAAFATLGIVLGRRK